MPTLGWIGLGVMGRSMCGHLLADGHPMVVFTRTPAKAQPLLEQGARWASSAREVLASADVIFTMLGMPAEVRDVYLGTDGLCRHARAGQMLVDMSTSEPSLAREIAEAARQREALTLDAPVSGGDVGARNATLSIMVGGERATFDRLLPLLELLGKNIVYQGAAGAGQHTKMCNQIMVAAQMIGVCESLLYAAKAGLDLQQMLNSIRSGAAGCWSLENLAPRILKDDFAPGFFVDHFVKDMGIALREAAAMQLALPGLALVHQLYVAVQAQGHGKCGTQALIKALQRLSANP